MNPEVEKLVKDLENKVFLLKRKRTSITKEINQFQKQIESYKNGNPSQSRLKIYNVK